MDVYVVVTSTVALDPVTGALRVATAKGFPFPFAFPTWLPGLPGGARLGLLTVLTVAPDPKTLLRRGVTIPRTLFTVRAFLF